MSVKLGLTHSGKNIRYGYLIKGKIFGLKWEEIRGDWRQLNNEDLHDL